MPRRCWPRACSPACIRRTGPMTATTPRARHSAESWTASAGAATKRSARARCTRSSNCISNRGRSWRPKAKISASSPTVRACRWTQVHHHRQGQPHRLDPDADAQERGLAMARVLEKVEEIALSPRPRRGGRGGPYRRLSQLAQRDPRQGGVHRRFPLARHVDVIEDMVARLKAARPADCATTWAWRSSSKRSAGSIRSTFDEGCVTAVRNAAERLGYSHMQPDLGRGPRCLLDQPRGPDGDGDVPLCGWPVP